MFSRIQMDAGVPQVCDFHAYHLIGKDILPKLLYPPPAGLSHAIEVSYQKPSRKAGYVYEYPEYNHSGFCHYFE
ncbi:hypothetical protein PbDSM24746_14030 [Paenibacillus macerans]|nr:hypothetical protein PbDSM24746_14030 [Paenibacillus macerans]GBK67702.1 hypothetical protein PbJCM17693_14100 [Paenibacillus macerans]GIP10563.1 hypothetical protein J1TS5_27330 [Paenibacillus macerans]